jgi:Rhodopirellula transposase DDE domain
MPIPECQTPLPRSRGYKLFSFRMLQRMIVTNRGLSSCHSGHPLYAEAESVLVCADSGGSNGYRLRLWKVELQRWASETGLDVTVCHYPPGTSKWNKIEHRLFSEITKNWRGRPLESYQVVVDLIGATITEKGLRVRADLDRGFYPTKVKVTDSELATVDLNPHDFHGEWNYTIKHQMTEA